MLEIIGMAGIAVSGAPYRVPPAIYWTAPAPSSELVISPKAEIRTTAAPFQRALSRQEEELIWAALRASSELVYRF